MALNNLSFLTIMPLTVTQSTITVFFVVLLVAKLSQIWRRRGALPPGPIGWPIVGHLPMLGKQPHLYFMKLWRKYGPLVYIRMGSRDTLIVNGYKACQDVFVDNINGRIFADRPDFNHSTFNCLNMNKNLAWLRSLITGGLRKKLLQKHLK